MVRGSHVTALVAATVLALATAPAGSAAKPKPVPSLQPRATAELWQRLVQRRHTARATADCMRLVFYTPTDWLRLATKLAANQVACAQHYISIPPLAADKTNFRPDQPWRIRALGSNFHAVEEISYNGWSSWVAANGGSWYAAGVEARRRMAAQGFDVPAGDTWSVNESSSAVRTGTGAARQNLRDLVRGLYDAGGSGPPAKGIVFVIGVGQSATSLSTYKGTLQVWYADTAFWADMSAYVSDWSQEAYGDIRNYAVPGAPLDARRDQLSAWLQHPSVLANAGPADIAAARSFLQTAYSPLANAAWPYTTASGFGWTDVPFDQMQDYVSAQTYALRSAGAHFGFAWSPNRPDGVTPTVFATESGAVADRLAAAIHDSAAAPEAACAASCTNAISGAWFNEGWKDFASWSLPTLVFANSPSTLAAGAPSGPLTARLELAGVARADSQPVAVTLASTSPRGGFAGSASGPWTSTLTVQIPAGSTDGVFYYRDTSAGAPTISATALGRAGAEQVVTVTPGSLATLAVTPASALLRPGETKRFAAAGADAYGNAIAAPVNWSATSGTLSPASGSSTTFRAGSPGNVTVLAAAGKVTGRAKVTVSSPVRVVRIAYARTSRRLRITLTVVDAHRRRVANASLRLSVMRNGRWVAAASLRTGSRGTATLSRNVRPGCYTIKIARVRARGFAGQVATPRNGYCAT